MIAGSGERPGGPLGEALAEAEAARRGRLPGLRGRRRWLRPLVRRHLGPVEADCRLFTGQPVRVVLPEIVGTELYRYGFIEPALTRVLIEYLRPGMVFVDVGAHYGYHSLVASRLVGAAGSVHAFEPGRGVRPLLGRNVAPAANVTVHDVAASDGTGTAEICDFGPVHSALTTLFGEARVPVRERRRLRPCTYAVRRVTLDDYLGARGIRPDVVKIDAEGAELAILHGMQELLEGAGPMLAVEVGDYDGMPSPDSAACLDFLEAHGYRALEYADGLRPHRRRNRYGYDNLYFVRD